MANDKKKNTYLWPGIILIVVGLYLLLPQLEKWWPIFILIPGLSFAKQYWDKSNRREHAELLTPAMITIGIAIFFFYLNYTSINKIAELWPIFPVIIGFSLFATVIGGNKDDRRLLVPAVVMSAVGVFFLLAAKSESKFWPVILIVFGGLLIASTIKIEKPTEEKEKTEKIDKPKHQHEVEREEKLESEEPTDEEKKEDEPK